MFRASESLSPFDYTLFSNILSEWESSSFLSSCFSIWQKYALSDNTPILTSLHVLSFNVRGFDLRWQEVLLLTSSFKFDILILLETGSTDISLCQRAFPNFMVYYQKGENRNGGVLVLARVGLQVIKVDCKLPNVCVIDIKADEELRVLGVYASDSRSWSWDELSPFVSNKCVLFGDFNVDLDQDSSKAEKLLRWADKNSLAPFVPNTPTSLRSNRVIDYAFAYGVNINIQTYKSNTTSDHLPIFSVIPFSTKQNLLDINIHWKVFSLFTDYAHSFWEEIWGEGSMDEIYKDYIRFLYLLRARCTLTFPLDRYRTAIPAGLRSFMSYVRALSFRQLKTRNPALKNKVSFFKKIVRKELKYLRSHQLSTMLHLRNTSAPISVSFWSKTKRYL